MKILTEIPPEAQKGQLVCMDLEMYGQTKERLHRPSGTLACLSIAMEGHKEVYQVYDDRDIRKVLDSVKKGTWVFHNSLYDLTQLRRWAIIKPRYIHDTMLMEQSMWGGYYQNFSLADLVRRWLGIEMVKEVRSEFETATEMSPQMKTYAANDAAATLLIAHKQREEYEGDPALCAYTRIDEPMIFPVLDMQGMRVNPEAWEKAVIEFEKKGHEVEAELGFNVKSTQQCHKAMAKVGLHLENTRNSTLMLFKDKPLIAKIIEGRLYRDAASKYGLKYLEKWVEPDGKIYPSWHITQAETGRMSASNPGAQQIPVRKLPIFRTFFIPSAGCVMVVSDASAQEPCVLAFESHDKVLLKILQSGESVHMMVAREIFHDPSINSKEDPRYNVGKTINLASSYGMSPYGLAARLNITEQEASQFLTMYFNKFRDVHNYIQIKRQEAMGRGYVTTASGRRCFLSMYDEQWERNCINAPIQGGAVDQTKMWTRLYWEMCKAGGIPYSLTAIIHDEQTKDVPKEALKDTLAINDQAFKQSGHFLFPGIPFRQETEVGKSWACKQMSEELLDEDEEDE